MAKKVSSTKSKSGSQKVEEKVEQKVEHVEEQVVPQEKASAKSTKKQNKKKVEKVAETVAVEQATNESEHSEPVKQEKKYRSFKSIYKNPDNVVIQSGRYCGIKPKQAACKALTGIYKTFKKAGAKQSSEIKFGVVETTRNSKHKKYWYSGAKVKLDKPVKVEIKKKDGQRSKIVYQFNNVVKKITEDVCSELVNCNPVEVQDDASDQDAKPQVKKAKSVKKSAKKTSKKTSKKAPVKKQAAKTE